MQVMFSFSECSMGQQPIVLAIGMFDGVHLGHQRLLEEVQARAHMVGGIGGVVTFSNHPAEVLLAERVPLLSHLSHRLNLLRNYVQFAIVLPFTKRFANQTPQQFISQLAKYLPSCHLVLGHDAVLGRDRQGNRDVVSQLATEFGMTVDYIEALVWRERPLSSSSLRKLVQQGALDHVSRQLGRPYSIGGYVTSGRGYGRQMGYPTANLSVQNLCVPPYGVYVAEVKQEGHTWSAIANLGVAPSLRHDGKPTLEVHLLESPKQLLAHREKHTHTDRDTHCERGNTQHTETHTN